MKLPTGSKTSHRILISKQSTKVETSFKRSNTKDTLVTDQSIIERDINSSQKKKKAGTDIITAQPAGHNIFNIKIGNITSQSFMILETAKKEASMRP